VKQVFFPSLHGLIYRNRFLIKIRVSNFRICISVKIFSCRGRGKVCWGSTRFTFFLFTIIILDYFYTTLSNTRIRNVDNMLLVAFDTVDLYLAMYRMMMLYDSTH